MAARFVDEPAELLLGVAVVVDQALIGLCFLDRVEVLALDILDQRDLERLLVAEIADDGGDFVQPRPLRRAPAPFAGDDLEARWPCGRTTIGWMTPRAWIEAASSTSASSWKIRARLPGCGSMPATGIIWRPTPSGGACSRRVPLRDSGASTPPRRATREAAPELAG